MYGRAAAQPAAEWSHRPGWCAFNRSQRVHPLQGVLVPPLTQPSLAGLGLTGWRFAPSSPRPQACWMCSRSLDAPAGRSSRTLGRVSLHGCLCVSLLIQCFKCKRVSFHGRLLLLRQCRQSGNGWRSAGRAAAVLVPISAARSSSSSCAGPYSGVAPGSSSNGFPSGFDPVPFARLQASSSPPTTSWRTTWACSHTRQGCCPFKSAANTLKAAVAPSRAAARQGLLPARCRSCCASNCREGVLRSCCTSTSWHSSSLLGGQFPLNCAGAH